MAMKKGPNVVMPDGSRVSLKDLGKVKPTPKPKPKPTILRETPAQYDARLRAALEAEKKAAAAKKKAGYK
jgi:hypothetical protein